MSTTVTLPAGTAETTQPVVSQPVEQTQPATPQQQTRQEIYNKYYSAATPTEQSTEQTVADPVETPVVETSTTTATPDDVGSRVANIESTLSKLVGALEQLSKPPQQPATKPVDATQESTWIDLMRAGKFDEAETLLASRIAKQFIPQTKAEATTEAIEMVRVDQELTSFVNDLRGKNPDLLPLEDFIAMKAQARLAPLQESLKSADDYIKAYKTAVNQSVEEARNLISSIRAASKEEANTRTQEVIASSTVSPQAVNANRGALPSKPSGPQAGTAEDYISKRRAIQARTAGLAV